MAGRECYHCKEWIAEGQAHDCWTTTEAALTRDLHIDLREAWERLRETAVEYGDQRIYASLNSIMFSRQACYFFVRPRRSYLEVCVFLGRPLNAPAIRRVMPVSKTKFAHMVRVMHRDEVEAPLTDWLREAYEFAGRTPTIGAGRVATLKTEIDKSGTRKAATGKAGTVRTANPRSGTAKTRTGKTRIGKNAAARRKKR